PRRHPPVSSLWSAGEGGRSKVRRAVQGSLQSRSRVSCRSHKGALAPSRVRLHPCRCSRPSVFCLSSSELSRGVRARASLNYSGERYVQSGRVAAGGGGGPPRAGAPPPL